MPRSKTRTNRHPRLESLEQRMMLSVAPVAVNDEYTILEDELLVVDEFEFSADFNPADSTALLASGATWRYLDRIENQLGDNDSYPTDSSGRAWNSIDFDESTSTVSSWGTGTTPLLAGTINAFPGIPGTLFGIGDAPGGQNLITTYLFRYDLVLDSQQAAQTEGFARLLCDDGCVVYVNGIEATRLNMDLAAVTTNTNTPNGQTGNENGYTDLSLDLASLNLLSGTNVIAVELHQATTDSSDIGFDMEILTGEPGSAGFEYNNGEFGGSANFFASGSYEPTAGFTGGAVRVFLNRGFRQFSGDASGGWSKNFNLPASGVVRVSLRYRMQRGDGFESDEFGAALLTIDGQAYGNDLGDTLVYNSGGGGFDSQWQQFEFDVNLDAGEHRLVLGVYHNDSNGRQETTTVFFDDVEITFGSGDDTSVLENDTDEDGDPLTAELVTGSGPQNGTLVFNADGSFIYTPNAEFSGVDSFRYQVSDGGLQSNEATVTITVENVNDPPLGLTKTYNVSEDETLEIEPSLGLLFGASDPDDPPESLTAVLLSGGEPANGTVSISADGSFQYTPSADFNGTDSFQYQVTDGEADSLPATVTINVSPVNDAPTVVDDTYTIEENFTLTIDQVIALTEVDFIAEGSQWNYLDDGSDQGTDWRLPEYDDGLWTQATAPGNNGAQYGYGDGDEATVIGFGGNDNNKFATSYFRSTFTVDDPTRVESLEVWILRDDSAAIYLNGVEIFRDASLAANASFADYSAGFGNDNATTTFTIDPALLTSDTNVLAVEVHQSGPGSSDVSFDLRVTAEVIDTAVGVLANDSDLEGNPFAGELVQSPANGTVLLQSDGTFVYTPNTNFEGLDFFTYQASDGQDTSGEATVTITVTPGPNDKPAAGDDAFDVSEDGTLLVTDPGMGVLENDSDSELDPFEAILASPPANGTVSLNSDGTFTYTPNADFFGDDTFTYTATDPFGSSDPATVTVTVIGTQDAPTAADDAYFAQPGEMLSVDSPAGILPNDSDLDNETITAILQGDAANGLLVLQADGSFTYAPFSGFLGVDTFTYRAFDGLDSSNLATVTITVDASPAANDDTYNTSEDEVLTVGPQGVLVNDTDGEDDTLTALVVEGPQNGQLALGTDGSLSYTPDLDFFGSDSFTYRANDSDQDSNLATVSITVDPVNDAPVGVADEYIAVQGGELVIDVANGVLGNDYDVDSASLTVELVGDVTNGTLALAADGSLTYTPEANFFDADTFTYQISDGTLTSEVTTATIFVASSANFIVINEIMYHPATENNADEYIELLNTAPGPVNLEGWQFSKGISFTFPDITIGSGELLVIAADVTQFMLQYPGVTNVIGGWEGRLSNSSEQIELEDANGERIDRVTYADSGDWAVRRSEIDRQEQGWTWEKPHDGGGPSLELINPAVSNRNGQNWAASDLNGGTPGVANSTADDSTAPLISDVKHSPAIPQPDDVVTVVAKLRDVEDTVIDASVFYRVADQNPGPWLSVPMFDDGLQGDDEAGDGQYGASLPALLAGTVVEFYVQASDDDGNIRTWPAPSDDAGTQGANAIYQVDTEAYDGNQPIMRVVMTGIEQQRLELINRQSNAQMNATLINVDGTGTDIRYNVGVRIRGGGSRFRTPPNNRINIPSDRPWQGVTALNLNSQYTFNQVLGMNLFTAAGLVAEDAAAVQYRINSVNPATQTNVQAGSFIRLETLNSDFAANHFPQDSSGNLYKGAGRLDYEGEGTAAYRNDYLKRTNASQDDFSDIINLTRALDRQQTPDNVFVETVRQIIDIDQWMRFFAVNSLLVNGENGLINGQEDDYSMYAGIEDPRFVLIPHDLDTIFNIGDGSANDTPERTLTGELDNNPHIARLLGVPEFLDLYYYHLRDLAETVFSAAQLNPFIDNLIGDFAPQNVIDSMKDFAAQRVAFVLSEVGNQGAPLPKATISGEPAAFTTDNSAMLVVAGEGVTDYRWRLDDGPYSNATPVGTPIDLSDLADGPHAITVLGSSSASGLEQLELDATESFTWTVKQTTSSVRINEVLASNGSALDHGGLFPDAIELFNSGTSSVDLSGMALSDDPNAAAADRFQFAAGTTIDVGEYLVLLGGDAASGETDLHVGFSLNGDGEGVYLFASEADGGGLIDQVVFGPQLSDLSIGRTDDLRWVLNQPTFGAANTIQPTGDVGNLQINEWLADGDRLFREDRIELFNPRTLPVDMGGLYLTDSPVNYRDKHQIAPLSFIAAEGYQVFIADENPEQGPLHVDFQLAAKQEAIGLFDRDLNEIDVVIFGPQASDVSGGRSPDGSPSYSRLFPPTFGSANPGLRLSISSPWSYDASGTDLGTAWRDPNFDDSAWSSGAGPLGFAPAALSIPLATPIDRVTFPTFYFRKRFQVDSIAGASIAISTFIDDGAVVYLNGVEVYRIGIAGNAGDEVAFSDTATRSVSAPLLEGPVLLSSSSLVVGENVIAVELHNSSNFSDDLVFGMELTVLTELVEDETPDVIRQLDELRITEMMYNPTGGSDYEFLELQNTGDTTLNLSGVRFTNGLDFTFGDTTLLPGQYTVIVRNQIAFEERYGTGINIAGQYDGKLDNSGENIELALALPFEGKILDFTFDDLWYPQTDGGGRSLVVVDPTGDTDLLSEPSGWRPSGVTAGTPGSDDTTDSTSPQVVEIIVSAEQWTQEFLDALDSSGLGEAGFSISVAAGQVEPLPWTNINRLTVVFNETVNVDMNALTLMGLNVSDFGPDSFVASSDRATWTFAEAISADKLLVGLSGSITDLSGNSLEGGDFSFRFDVMPGDVTGDGTTNRADIVANLPHQFSRPGDARYSATQDIDGDGIIGILDLIRLGRRLGLSLPAGEPGVAPSAAAAAVVVVAARAATDLSTSAETRYLQADRTVLSESALLSDSALLADSAFTSLDLGRRFQRVRNAATLLRIETPPRIATPRTPRRRIISAPEELANKNVSSQTEPQPFGTTSRLRSRRGNITTTQQRLRIRDSVFSDLS